MKSFLSETKIRLREFKNFLKFFLEFRRQRIWANPSDERVRQSDALSSIMFLLVMHIIDSDLDSSGV